MLKRNIKAGVWTALVTPFQQDGSIDLKNYDQLVALQLDAKVTGVVVSGTTGESPTLSGQEKLDLIKRTREIVGPEFGVMAGTGGNDTAASIQLSQQAVAAGADSLLVVTPPYNKPSLAGLIAHFSAIAASTEVPVCLYHVPGRTAQRLSAEAFASLCEIRGVEAIKEASGDVTLFQQAILSTPASTKILSGDDFTYLASLAVGGNGCISVASNLYPKALVEMTKALFRGDFDRAKLINLALFPVYEALFCETNPAPIKEALFLKKLIATRRLRLPLVPVSSKSSESIQTAIDRADLALSELKV